MNVKKTVVLLASVIGGNYLAERYVLKSGPDDPTGFVQVADGLGMDDVARAVAVVATVYAADMVARKVGFLKS